MAAPHGSTTPQHQAVAIGVLVRRSRRASTLLLANLPILIYFLYCFISVVWSYHPDVAFKRWIKALGDPTRVRLLSLIAATAGGEACICDLTEPVGLSQPTVSHHMKQLTDAGLISREQRGKWAYFRVVGDALDSLAEALSTARAAR